MRASFTTFTLSGLVIYRGCLNRGLLPPNYYALAEQVAGGVEPDVLTLQSPGGRGIRIMEPSGGVALAEAPPRVQYHLRAEPDAYPFKSRSVAIRHVSNHKVVALMRNRFSR